jgi:hypothetical protein
VITWHRKTMNIVLKLHSRWLHPELGALKVNWPAAAEVAPIFREHSFFRKSRKPRKRLKLIHYRIRLVWEPKGRQPPRLYVSQARELRYHWAKRWIFVIKRGYFQEETNSSCKIVTIIIVFGPCIGFSIRTVSVNT